MAAAPIVVDGVLWGAVAVATLEGRLLPPGVDHPLARLGDMATLAVSSAQARNRLAHLASTDELTGLANRRVFNERIESDLARSRRSGHPLSLVMVDLDHFKAINDEHGHPVGDEVLTEFAERLRAAARAGDLVARVGGEEFALILPECGADRAEATAERLRRLIASAPFDGVGTVTASFGVASSADLHPDEDLFTAADRALYEAKKAGRDVVIRHPGLTRNDLSGLPLA